MFAVAEIFITLVSVDQDIGFVLSDNYWDELKKSTGTARV